MEDKNKDTPREEKQKKQSLKEQAINKKEADGEEVNDQVKERREKHLPRDTA